MNILAILQLGKERFPALTGIRALAVISIFFVHLPFAFGFHFIINPIGFFFVLSGFLIIYLYYQSSAFSRVHLVNYFTNRFARLYPVYFLLVSIAVWHNHDFDPLLLLKNYTLTHALFHNTQDILIQPSWSLTVEECFYFLAPVIMFLIRKYNFFVSFLLGVFLLGAALLISKAPILFLHTPEFVMTTTFFGYFFEFYAGVWLAMLIIKRDKNGMGKRKGSAFTVAGVIGVILCFAAQDLVYNLKGPLNIPAVVLLNNFVFALPITVLYFGLICEDTRLSVFLSGKFLGVLGRTTYTFYIVHMLVINYLAIPFLLQYFGGHYNLFVITAFFVTELVAILLFILYEEPLNIFIRRKVKKLNHSNNRAKQKL